MKIKYLTLYLLTINLLISADSDGDGIDDTVDEGKMVFHAAVQLGQITYSDFGGSSEAEELLSNLSRSTIHWYGEFNQADLNKYTNNVNLHTFEMSDSQKAYIEISGSGDSSLDGIHYIDEYWGELNMLSQSDWGEIYFESQVNINGNNLTIESPRFRFSQNILDSKLESIIGLPYTIEDRSLMIDLMMGGESFTATMQVDPLRQGGSIYYTSLADVEGYTGLPISLMASPDSDSDGVTNAFDIYPNDSSQTLGTDSDGDGIDDTVDEGKMVFHAAVQLGQITYSDFGGSSEAEELLSNLSRSTIHWYGEFNQADLNKYTNNVNLHTFEMSDSQKAYIEISGSGDSSLDGIHYIDEYWGELNMLSQSDWGEIYFESQVNINGNNLTIESPRFRFSQNILDSKLESIIGLPYTIEDRSLMIDLMMGGESFTATMQVDPLRQGGSIYYTSLADVEGYTGLPISLMASPDSDSDGVTNAFDIYPNDSSQTLGTDSDGDGIDDHVDAFPSDASETITIMKLTENGYAKMSDISDLREGSVMIEVIDGIATLDLEMEVTNNLDSDSWTEVDGSATMSIPADTSTKFFRFKMAD